MSTKKSLLFKISTDIREFQKGMRQATTDLRRFGKQMKDIGSNFSMSVTLPITAFATGSVIAFRSFNESMKQVKAGVESTGGAAGFTAEELKKMSKSLSLMSATYSGDILQGVTAQLLTFTNVVGPQFEKAQVAILDVATRMKVDLKTAAIQVGKALNDPIKGVTALAKSGIQFTAAQKQVIRGFVETGQLAKAQELILKELEVQFGGSAAASGDAIDHMTNKAREMGVSFGELIMRSITPLVNSITKLLTWIENTSEGTKKFIIIVGGIAAAIGPVLLTIGFFASSVLPNLIMGVQLAVKAFTALKVAMLGNPYFAIAAGIAAVSGIIYLLVSRLREGTEAQKAFNAVNEKTNQEFDKQKAKVEMLKSAVENNTYMLYYRLEALKELQAIVPDYNASINEEGILINNNTIAIENYLKSIEKEIRLKAYKQQLEEQYLKKIAAEKKIQESLMKIQQFDDKTDAEKKNMPIGSAISAMGFYKGLKSSNEAAKKELNEIINSIKLIEKEIGGISETVVVKVDITTNAQGIKKTLPELKAELKKLEAIKLNAIDDELEDVEANIELVTNAIKELDGAVKPGKIQQLQIALENLEKTKLSFTGSEQELAKLNDRIKEVQKEITRLNSLTLEIADLQKIIQMPAITTVKTQIKIDKKKESTDNLNLTERDTTVNVSYFKPIIDQAYELRQIFSGIVDLIGSGLSSAFESALTSGENFWKVLGKMLVDLVKKLVAAVAAALTLSVIMSAFTGGATSALNFLGMSGSGFSGLFKGLFGKMAGIPGMAKGGVVPSGFPNDTYPALLTSGEKVIPSPDPLENTAFGNDNNMIVRMLTDSMQILKSIPTMLTKNTFADSLQNISFRDMITMPEINFPASQPVYEGGGNMTVTGRLVADGSQLLAVIDNASLKRNKIRGY